MSRLNFDDLFLQADNLRNNAKIDEAIAAYLDIVSLASAADELKHRARAFHMAGVSAHKAITEKTGAYYRDALNNFSQAEPLYRQMGDTVGLGNLYRDVAVSANYAKDTANAAVYFQKSLELLEAADDKAALAITYDKMGLHVAKLGQLDEGLTWITKAEHTIRQTSVGGFWGATILLDKACLLTKKGEYEQAFDVAEQSLSWFEADHGNESYDQRRCQLYGLLALLCAQTANSQSETYFRKYQELLRRFDAAAAQTIESELKSLEA